MNLGFPLHDLAPGPRGAVLDVLARLERPVSRRELAAMAGISASHAGTIVETLLASGLAHETRAGNALLVALNRRHLLAEPLLAVARARSSLVARLRRELATWPDLRGAWLFGSVARGTADSASDVDVAIIVDDVTSPDLHGRIGELHEEVESYTGNRLQLVEYDVRSWRALVESGNALAREIQRDGVPLTGDDASPLRRAG